MSDFKTRTVAPETEPEYVGAHSGAEGVCGDAIETEDGLEWCDALAIHTVVMKANDRIHEAARLSKLATNFSLGSSGGGER
jgi:hypothetical protein